MNHNGESIGCQVKLLSKFPMKYLIILIGVIYSKNPEIGFWCIYIPRIFVKIITKKVIPFHMKYGIITVFVLFCNICK